VSLLQTQRTRLGPGFPRDNGTSTRFARFIGVGIWNTLFGYASYAALTYLFSPRYPTYGYLIAAVVSNALALTVAFLGYKWLVFKTRGNYLGEGTRFLIVYGASSLLGLLVLPLLVFAIRHFTRAGAAAPYIGAAVLICCNAVVSFAGNELYTFKQRIKPGAADEREHEH
jgi:putative flippase GtrA